MERTRLNDRSAFTLIEMLAVVTILGLASAGVLMSVRQPLARAKLQQDVTQWQSVDNLLREQAINSQQALTLSIDLDQGALWKESTAGRVLLASGMSGLVLYGPDGEHTSGEISITYRVDGSTESYGIRLGQPARAAKFLWIAGGSGQISVKRGPQQIQAMWKDVRDA